MAITKRAKVTFDVTFVIDSETQKEMNEGIIGIAKRIGSGGKVDPVEREWLVAALNGGEDGAAEFLLKKAMRDIIKGAHEDLCEIERKALRFSPATVRVVR